MEKYFSFVPLPFAAVINFIGGLLISQTAVLFGILPWIFAAVVFIIAAANIIAYKFCKYFKSGYGKEISPGRAYAYGVGMIIMTVIVAFVFYEPEPAWVFYGFSVISG